MGRGETWWPWHRWLEKLHLGVDGSGVLVYALTGGHEDDATTALDLITELDGEVSRLTADAAYDTDRHLPGGGRAWRTGGYPADPDGHGLGAATPVLNSRPHCPAGAPGRR